MTKNRINILLVEDDLDLQNVYKLILKSQGYKVRTANNGVEALASIKDTPPDIILLDYFMPHMDGKKFLQNFNKADYPNIQIVVASNVAEQHTLDELISLGADRSVLKSSLSPTELLSLVETLTRPSV